MTGVLLIIGVGIGLGLLGRKHSAGHSVALVVVAIAVTIYELLGGSS